MGWFFYSHRLFFGAKTFRISTFSITTLQHNDTQYNSKICSAKFHNIFHCVEVLNAKCCYDECYLVKVHGISGVVSHFRVGSKVSVLRVEHKEVPTRESLSCSANIRLGKKVFKVEKHSSFLHKVVSGTGRFGKHFTWKHLVVKTQCKSSFFKYCVN